MLIGFLFLLSFVAFSISAVAGGGAGLMLMPVLAMLLPGSQVASALSVGTMASSLSRIATFWGAIRWDVVRWFLPAALPGAALGAFALTWFEPVYIKLVLGLFLTANLPLLFLRKRPVPDEGGAPIKPAFLLALGAAVGLISGFTGAVGVLFNRFYFRLRLQKAEIVATRATNEVLLHALKIVLYASFGLLTTRSLMAGAIIAVAAVAASSAVRRLLHHVPDHLFHHASTTAMVVAGVSMLGGAVPAALARNKAGLQLISNTDEQEVQAFWGKHAYSAAFTRHSGISLEKKLDPAHLKPRYRRLIPAAPEGARITSIEKFEQIDREGLEIHYAQGQKHWEQVIVVPD